MATGVITSIIGWVGNRTPQTATCGGAGPAGVINVGDEVEFESTDWGGLAHIAPAE